MSNNVYLQVLTVKWGKQTISKETNKMITKSDNTIKRVKQGDETWVMEEREAIFDVEICEGPFRAVKTRRQPWQGPEEEGQSVPSHQDRKKIGGHVQGMKPRLVGPGAERKQGERKNEQG